MKSEHALIISIVAGAIAQLSMKAGLVEMDSFMPSPPLIFGLACYSVAMICWIVALKKYQLGYAYPLLSIGYVLVYIGAVFWPGIEEAISWNKSIGIFLVIIGVTICAQNNNSTMRSKRNG